MNQFVHVDAKGKIVIDDPPEKMTNDEARAYVQGVRAELKKAFAGKPQGALWTVNLRSERRGCTLSSVSDVITNLMPEVHDRAKRHRAKQGRSRTSS